MPTKSAVKSRQKPKKTATELEAILAERFGCSPSQVIVRGEGSEWEATLIVNMIGNAERKARFWRLAFDARGEFDVKR